MNVPDDLPLGAKIEVDEIYFTTGGGGTNAAVTFARQGYKTACIGVVGRDDDGSAIITELMREGVDVSQMIHHTDDRTAYSSILIHPEGERTILSYKGEGQHFSTTNVRVDHLEAKWFYLSSLGGHLELARALMDRARSIGAKIAWNPGGREIALKPSMHVDILSMNKEEAAALGGSVSADIMMVTDGPRGVTVTERDGKTHFAQGSDDHVVDRTGAGDAYCSGFVAEFMRSGIIERAIQFGVANASSVVTQYGAKAGILKE